MSSLPQGWHGIPVPTRNSISSSVTAATTVPTTIRKKWNSPMSSEVPRSKLPAFKPSNLRQPKNPVNGTLSSRTSSKTSCTVPKNDVSTCPTKASPTKQYQTEIAKLKKELTTVKTENSILKVKVRRVDDENVQKSRQIEKLRMELKAAQKVESTNSKKNKDSELLLLRQKCLRLEGALKEKDLALNTFRRLNNEASLKVEGTASRNSTSNLAAGDADDIKKEKLNETYRTSGKTSLPAQTSLSRSSHSTKTEVAKLREMIHKLEKENQDLQQQVKDKGEEIRRLKMHLRSRTYVKTPQTSESKTTFKTNSVPKLEPVPNVPKPTRQTTNTLKSSKLASVPDVTKPKSVTAKAQRAVVSQIKKTDARSITKPLPRVQSLLPNSNNAVKSQEASIPCNGVLKSQPSRKQMNGTQSRSSITNSGKTFFVSKPVVSNSEKPSEDMKDEVQRMRENIAAKRIQRSWRDHQKRHSRKDDVQNMQKALTFIVTSLKHHKLRKEKMNILQKRKNLSPRIKMDDEGFFVEAIQTAARNLWEREISTAHTN